MTYIILATTLNRLQGKTHIVNPEYPWVDSEGEAIARAERYQNSPNNTYVSLSGCLEINFEYAVYEMKRVYKTIGHEDYE